MLEGKQMNRLQADIYEYTYIHILIVKILSRQYLKSFLWLNRSGDGSRGDKCRGDRFRGNRSGGDRCR